MEHSLEKGGACPAGEGTLQRVKGGAPEPRPLASNAWDFLHPLGVGSYQHGHRRQGGDCGGLCGPFSTWVCVASTSPEQAKQTECGSFPTLRGGGPLPEGTYLLPWEAWSQATSVTCQTAKVSEQTLSPDLTRC